MLATRLPLERSEAAVNTQPRQSRANQVVPLREGLLQGAGKTQTLGCRACRDEGSGFRVGLGFIRFFWLPNRVLNLNLAKPKEGT